MCRPLRVATWNLEWATPGSARHERALGHLVRLDADIIVTTEDSLHDWDEYPHRIDGGSDWGYPIRGQRRKVIAWSRTPWVASTHLAAPATQGRFVCGMTDVGGKPIQVLAVCIPWPDAHVRGGRADRKRWAEHVDYCEALGPAVAESLGSGATIVAGDFNQRIPRSRQPHAVADSLGTALGPLHVASAGCQSVGQLIDHIAVSSDLTVHEVSAWPSIINGGTNQRPQWRGD